MFIFWYLHRMSGKWLSLVGLTLGAGRMDYVYFIPFSSIWCFLWQVHITVAILILKFYFPLKEKLCRYHWHFLHSKTKNRKKMRDPFNIQPKCLQILLETEAIEIFTSQTLIVIIWRRKPTFVWLILNCLKHKIKMQAFCITHKEMKKPWNVSFLWSWKSGIIVENHRIFYNSS